MSDRELIIPSTMQSIMDRAGYAPAVRVGDTLYCAGQVGRTRDMEVILNPEAQFIACWENLRTVLAEGGCTFEDIVDMTTYHVAMSEHMAVFREVKTAYSRVASAPGPASALPNWRTPGCCSKSSALRSGATTPDRHHRLERRGISCREVCA